MASSERIFRYLCGTKNYRLRYFKTTEIQAYSYADWASEIDQRKSCSGLIINMSNAAICLGSKRQNIVALSTTEAEYIALSFATREVMWLRQLASEIDNKPLKATTIYCDNQSTINLATLDAYRSRTKHIDIRFHHTREQVEKKVIIINYLPTESMVADSLTKAVSSEKHKFCAEKEGLVSGKN